MNERFTTFLITTFFGDFSDCRFFSFHFRMIATCVCLNKTKIQTEHYSDPNETYQRENDHHDYHHHHQMVIVDSVVVVVEKSRLLSTISWSLLGFMIIECTKKKKRKSFSILYSHYYLLWKNLSFHFIFHIESKKKHRFFFSLSLPSHYITIGFLFQLFCCLSIALYSFRVDNAIDFVSMI